MSAVAANVSPQQAVRISEDFLRSFVPEAKDVMVEGLDMGREDEWVVILGFNLPSPLDAIRSPIARPSLERDHHRKFKINTAAGKIISMAPTFWKED